MYSLLMVLYDAERSHASICDESKLQSVYFSLLKEWFFSLYLGAIDIGVRVRLVGPILAARNWFVG